MMTLAQLQACLPYAGERAALFLDPLNSAMDEFGIDTLLRKASFIAQVAHESGSLKYTLEIADGKAYEGRHDLGNVQPGDGPRFRGRGLIQLTGRKNYESCGRALGKDLISEPTYLETPVGASRSAAWFWKANGLNDIADQGNFGTLTKRINGGYNGLDDRIKHYVRARKALGI